MVFAFNDGFWDVAYYRKQEGDPFEERFAIRKKILLDAFRILFAEADEPFDAEGLISYIKRRGYPGIMRVNKLLERSNDPKDYDPRTAEIPY